VLPHVGGEGARRAPRQVLLTRPLSTTTSEPVVLAARGEQSSAIAYLQGIDNAEIIATVHARTAPMIPASTGRRM
jgi:hypothetical protein